MKNLKKYRKKYDLSKNLADITNGDKWFKLSTSLSRCFACDEISTTPMLKVTLGNICSKCITEELEDIFLNGVSLKFSLMELSVKLHGSFINRYRTLYLLEKRKNLFEDIESELKSEKDTFLRALILNLGYENLKENSLSRGTIRQITFRILSKIGHNILNEMYVNYDNTNPILQANLGYFYALFFDKYQSVDLRTFVEIKERLIEIAKSDTYQVKKSLLLGIENANSSSFLAELLKRLMKDNDYSISRKANAAFDKLPYRIKKEADKKKTPHRTLKKNDLNIFDYIKIETEEMKYLYNDIKEYYSAEKLKKMFQIYFVKIFNISDNIAISRLKKDDLIKLFAKMLTNKELFNLFLEIAPDDTKKIFEYILLDSFPKTKTEIAIISTEVFTNSSSYSYYKTFSVKDDYLIFPILYENSYYTETSIFLPQKFRTVILDYFDMTEIVSIKFYENRKEVEKMFEFSRLVKENDFISDFFVNFAFITQNKVTYAKSGNKVLKNYYTKMENYLNFEEFYPPNKTEDRDLYNVKKDLIIDFFENIEIQNVSQTPENLVKIYNSFFNGKLKHNFSFEKFIPYIKFNSYSDYGFSQVDDRDIKKEVIKIFKELNTVEWFDVDSIITNILFRNNDIIDFEDYRGSSYFLGNDENSYNRNYHEKILIKYSHCKDVLFGPIIKGFFYLSHILGILDIAYNQPNSNGLKRKSKTYLSNFDGLEVVRLTKFGEYFVGKIKEYNYESKIKETIVNLDSNRLYIFVSGNNPLKLMQLEKVSEKMRDGYYKTDFNIFYKDCKTKDDILDKIVFFKKNISADLPEIWQDFFIRIENRVSPLKRVSNLIVFKLEENKELLQLFSKDKILSDYVIKAENFHIMVNRKVVFKVETRLKELGYFVNLK